MEHELRQLRQEIEMLRDEILRLQAMIESQKYQYSATTPWKAHLFDWPVKLTPTTGMNTKDSGWRYLGRGM